MKQLFISLSGVAAFGELSRQVLAGEPMNREALARARRYLDTNPDVLEGLSAGSALHRPQRPGGMEQHAGTVPGRKHPTYEEPMSTTTTPEQELAALETRRGELASQLQGLDQQIEQERTAMGRAVAKGKDGSAHRAKTRDLGEEAEGLRRALPIVEGEMQALQTRIKEARLEAAKERYEESADRRTDAVAQVDKALRTFIAEDLAKLRTEMDASVEAERSAASAYDATASVLGQYSGPPMRTGPFERHRGLPLLLNILDQYMKGDGIPGYGDGGGRRHAAEETAETPLAFR
jgi:hypothetical protein